MEHHDDLKDVSARDPKDIEFAFLSRDIFDRYIKQGAKSQSRVAEETENIFGKEGRIDEKTLSKVLRGQQKATLEIMWKVRWALEKLTGRKIPMDDLIEGVPDGKYHINQERIKGDIRKKIERSKEIGKKWGKLVSLAKTRKKKDKDKYLEERQKILGLIEKKKQSFKKETLALIDQLKGEAIKAQFIIKLARIYYEWGDYDWSLEILNLIYVEGKDRDETKKQAAKSVLGPENHLERVRVSLQEADIYKRTQKHIEAFRVAQAALHFLRLEGDWKYDETHLLEAHLLNTLSEALRKTGFGRTDYCEVGLHITAHLFGKEASDLEGNLRNGIGILLQEDTETISTSITLHEEAINAFRKSGNRRNEAHTQIYLAQALIKKSLTVNDSRRKGLVEEAEKHLESSLDIFGDIGDRAGIANCYYRKALCATTIFSEKTSKTSLAADRNKYDRAIDDLEKAEELHRESDGKKPNRRGIFYALLLKQKMLLKKAKGQKGTEKEKLFKETGKILEEAKRYIITETEEGSNEDFIEDYRAMCQYYIYNSEYYIIRMLDLGITKNDLKKGGKNCKSWKEYKEKAEKSCRKIENIKNAKKDEEPTSIKKELEIEVSLQLKEEPDKTEKYIYPIRRGQYIAQNHLNLSYIYLEDALNSDKPEDAIAISLNHVLEALSLFRHDNNEYGKGRCYVQKARIFQRQGEILEIKRQNRAFLKRRQNYLEFAKSCFEKIDRFDWIGEVKKELDDYSREQ